MEITKQNDNDDNNLDNLEQGLSESLSISSLNVDDSKDTDFADSDYSNDDPVASPDYFDGIYGLNQRKLSPDHEKNKSNEVNNNNNSFFSFGDANNGFSFCDENNKDKNGNTTDKNKDNEDGDKGKH
eukprot:CAMPEP_0201591964 /NCGR_PEP_ID=MMETSP0190_2-20130828/189986_1 /ASSEMBLY_ACC=CAM_ASM_000263 /TAXON_ID=37353 /ORGANISM="Rosalina sp." /LENGTH=126 /DNA_ID=CAMNT_0048050515 /DNA_START=809 /DNA_END=1190 /DNA_ORIENTATION=+